MDEKDRKLITALRKDGRASISNLSLELGLSRPTVRHRIEQMQARGDILGFGVILREDTMHMPVRGHMAIGIAGQETERVVRKLSAISEVEAIHTTNGKWDLIVELGAESLEHFDRVLRRIRQIEGVATSETNLLLATRKMTKARLV